VWQIIFPYLSAVNVVLRSRFRPRLNIGDESLIHLRVGFSDIDVYPEVKNGRHLALMDLGRFDFAARTGLIGLIRQKNGGWSLAGPASVIGGKSPF
jgi:hypothetical protein